ncbi:MAG TPA: ribosome silencing factor [Bacteroidales bacterium]|nr:ribosome silencing factor [Bacteroidales bacterium]
MAKRKRNEASDQLADIVIHGMQERKANDIVKLNLGPLQNSITDYFIICHGTSRTQVEAIADSVEAEVKKSTGQSPWHREGFENCEWVLLDYYDVVVHIFQPETRNFYQLERLWADAERTDVS